MMADFHGSRDTAFSTQGLAHESPPTREISAAEHLSILMNSLRTSDGPSHRKCSEPDCGMPIVHGALCDQHRRQKQEAFNSLSARFRRPR
jgi:hypothetical protein